MLCNYPKHQGNLHKAADIELPEALLSVVLDVGGGAILPLRDIS